MSKKTLKINLISLFIMNAITILSGFVVPKLIIENYGSDANGLIISVTQFFGYMILLYGGVGGVVRATLYPKINEGDNKQISIIYSATKIFFRKISYFTIVFSIILSIIYPLVIDTKFNFFYINLIILTISIQFFFQYFFGITNQILISASGRDYVYSLLQSISLVLVMLGVYVMTQNGYGIHEVLLYTNVIYLIRPLILFYYVKNRFDIDYKSEASKDVLKNRWDGMAHTIAYFIHSKIDVFFITFFLTLKDVSIYSIYVMIISGVRILVTTISNSIEPYFGKMRGIKSIEFISDKFSFFVIIFNLVLSIVISATFVLIIPFVTVYTQSFNSSEYINFSLAYLIIIAEFFYMIRQPYASIIVAFGHYKETKKGAYIEASINVIMSTVLVIQFKLNGLIIATGIAMLYRYIDNLLYLNRNILKINLRTIFTSNILVVVTILCNILLINRLFSIEVDSYLSWIYYGLIITIFSSFVSIIIYSTVYFSPIMKHLKKSVTKA